MTKFETFLEDLEQGRYEEDQLCDFLYRHVLTVEDRLFLASNAISIPMILNGRVEEPGPWKELKEMCDSWNTTVGGKVIFTDGWVAEEPGPRPAKIKFGSDEYKRLALEEAVYELNVIPCQECGAPSTVGYCCNRCGSTDPDGGDYEVDNTRELLLDEFLKGMKK